MQNVHWRTTTMTSWVKKLGTCTYCGSWKTIYTIENAAICGLCALKMARDYLDDVARHTFEYLEEMKQR